MRDEEDRERLIPHPCALIPAFLLLHQLLRVFHNIRNGDPQLFQSDRAHRRCAEAVNADGRALTSDVLPPAHRRTGLDRDLCHSVRKMLILYASSCSSKILKLGMETTVARIPAAFSSSAAFNTTDTSEPVPTNTTSLP